MFLLIACACVFCNPEEETAEGKTQMNFPLDNEGAQVIYHHIRIALRKFDF